MNNVNRLIKKVKKAKNRRIKINYGGEKLSVYISPVFLVMAAYFGITGQFFGFVCAFCAVILHEFSHAAVAKKCGYALNELKLMPYGAGLYGAFEGVKSGDEVIIAAAGPLLNFVLSLVFVAVWWLIPETYAYTEPFVRANLALAVFNLLPVYPLDGGRALLALLSKNRPRFKAYKISRIIGFTSTAILLVLIAISCAFSFNQSLIADEVFFVTTSLIPDKRCKYSPIYDAAYRSERLKRGAPVRVVAVKKEASLKDLFKLLSGESYTVFSVLDDGLSEVARVDETALMGFLSEFSQDKSVYGALSEKRDNNEFLLKG